MSKSSTPDPLTKGLPPWLVFVIAVVVPPAAFLPFARSLTLSPLLIALLLFSYEVVIFLIRFMSKIWQNIENPLVSLATEQLKYLVRGIFSSYRKGYFDYLLYQHRDFDVRGLSTQGIYTLDLERVFVELSIIPTPVHQVDAHLLQSSKNLTEDSHPIRYYLTTSLLARQHLVILGAPGTGQTTLMKHIVLSLIERKKHYHLQKQLYTLPILLFLREHADNIREQPDYSLIAALQVHLKQWSNAAVSLEWLKRRLERGHCLVMLDGLDEVADLDKRKAVAQWVQQQMITYGKNRFLITSRPFGYRDSQLRGVTILAVSPLTFEQIKDFVYKWYLANEIMSKQKDDPGTHMKAQEGANDLLQRLWLAPALLEFATNPLLLTMITTVHRYRSSLPGKRVALYAEIFEVVLGKRQEAKGLVLELSPAQKLQVLQPLAYYMMVNKLRDISFNEARNIIASPLSLVRPQLLPQIFLEDIQNNSGLLLERENDRYCFAHLTFQEYLAAVHIKEENLEQVLIGELRNSWWHETIRLYCAQADATRIIEACLTGDKPSIVALILAIECQQEALKIQQSARLLVDTMFIQGIEDSDTERRYVIAEALLALRIRNMQFLNENLFIDTSLITNAEYQLFLDEQRLQGKYYQPAHWIDNTFPAGSGLKPVLGVSRSDAIAFCQWLNKREGRVWHYRLPTTYEIQHLQDKHRWKELSPETGYWVSDDSQFVWSQRNPSSSLQEEVSRIILSAHNRDRSVKSTLGRVIIRDRDLNTARDLARDLARELAFGLSHAPDDDRNIIQSLFRVQSLVRAMDLALDVNIDKDDVIPCGLDLARDLACARDLALDLDLAPNLASALILARTIYIAIVSHCKRIEGKLPAYEGILLVKENHQKKLS